VGGNREQGKIYPNGSRSNDTVYNASTPGKFNNLKKKGGYEITIDNASNGCQVIDIVSPGFGRYGTETRNKSWNTYCASKKQMDFTMLLPKEKILS
jgi:hypothetical protein